MMQFFQNNHDWIIYVIVGIILCFQLILFIKNFIKIIRYRKAINGVDQLEIVDVQIPEEAITEINPNNILKNKERYQKEKSLDENVEQQAEEQEDFDETNDYDESDKNKPIILGNNSEAQLEEEDDDLPF